MKKFYFTFGFAHVAPQSHSQAGKALGNHYVTIEAEDSASAREAMFSRFGDRWSFQYDEKGFEGQVEKYHLKELECIKQIIN